MISDENLHRSVEWIERCGNPLLISHEKPDGDALGSLAALSSILRAKGRRPAPLLFDPLPARYELFLPHADWQIMPPHEKAPQLQSIDSIIIVDTSAYSQMPRLTDWLRQCRLPKLVIDHHQTRDAIADLEVADTTAAATCLILYEVAEHAKWALTHAAAEALFVGIATDTGWFRHSNTDGRALSACAELLNQGVKAYQLFQALYHRDSAARVQLLGEALASLQLHAQDRLAVQTLDQPAFKRSGASPADTEDIVNEPLRIASVMVSVLLVDQGDGKVRVNLRSKPPVPGSTEPDVDVAALAAAAGGGGHRRAAGARVQGELGAVRAGIVEKVLQALSAGGSSQPAG